MYTEKSSVEINSVLLCTYLKKYKNQHLSHNSRDVDFCILETHLLLLQWVLCPMFGTGMNSHPAEPGFLDRQIHCQHLQFHPGRKH